jgi:hypothetical protein
VIARVVGTIVVAVVVAHTAGCWGTTGHLVDNRFQDDKVSYTVGLPGDGWRPLQLDRADIAWHNPDLGAGLLVNSACEGVQDSPLIGLTNELLIGTTEREILEQNLLPWSRREALESVVLGKLDGIARKRAIFVLKKDGCVYDIVYDAPPATFEAGLAAYRRVRDGFDVGLRRDRSGA